MAKQPCITKLPLHGRSFRFWNPESATNFLSAAEMLWRNQPTIANNPSNGGANATLHCTGPSAIQNLPTTQFFGPFWGCFDSVMIRFFHGITEPWFLFLMFFERYLKCSSLYNICHHLFFSINSSLLLLWRIQSIIFYGMQAICNVTGLNMPEKPSGSRLETNSSFRCQQNPQRFWPTQRWLILTAHGNGYCHQWQQRQNRQDGQALRVPPTENRRGVFGKLRVWHPQTPGGFLFEKIDPLKQNKPMFFFAWEIPKPMRPTSLQYTPEN